MSCDLTVPVLPRAASDDSAYQAALAFLYERINYEQMPREPSSAAGFKLDRMQALLERLGNPHEQLPAIHIAGTKGKGSTAAMCAAILQAVGYRVGLFTSPHIDRFEERMCVDGAQPSPREVVELVREVANAAQQLEALGPDWSATFFEVTTAMAWLLFCRAQTDVVVLEVGLGGRLDATNLCRPLATLITSISRDHTRLLGESLSEIAREKAGIIKPSVPVLSGVTEPPAADVIAAAAARAGAPLYRFGHDIVCREVCRVDAGGPIASWLARITTPWRQHPLQRVPLAGEHQITNAALALAAVDWVSREAASLDEAAVARGLSELRWPLRIEVLGTAPLVVADAAHNSASMTALVQTLQTAPARQRIAVFSASRDKDVGDMLRIAAGFFDRILLTRYTSNPRAIPLDELAACAAAAGIETATVTESPLKAWQCAHAEAGPEDLICICGSFFLAAELRDVVLSDRR